MYIHATSRKAKPTRKTDRRQRKTYDEIQKVIDKKKNKGPMYICGDWDARLIYPTSTEEEEII